MKFSKISIHLSVFLIVILIIATGIPLLRAISGDPFEKFSEWKIHTSDQVKVSTSVTDGKSDQCLKMDIDFIAGSGYGGVQKKMPLDLPANFKFSFYVKSDLPVNNLEFKLIDESGDNVWWYNQRNFEFPGDWEKITVMKRNIQFAWGPTQDKTLGKIDKIEIIVASVNGGKGSLYLDELKFEKFDPPDPNPPKPVLTASSRVNDEFDIRYTNDENLGTFWRSDSKTEQEIIIDCLKYREFGGLVIDWDTLDFAVRYDVLVSNNKIDWDTAYEVNAGSAGRRYLNLKNYDSRYIKLLLKQSNRCKGYAIADIIIKDYEFVRTPENFFRVIAADSPRGLYPRYFLDEQSYWTITGPPNDDNEALINEDGTVEVDRRDFTIEPFVFLDQQLYTWHNSKITQHLVEGYLPIPSVLREMDGLQLETKIFADKDKKGSLLYLIYTVTNQREEKAAGNLYLAIRPFQVNPPLQFLNNPGGCSPIKSIKQLPQNIEVDDKIIIPVSKPNAFGATEFDTGEIMDFIQEDHLPINTAVTDHFGYASAALTYSFDLEPDEQKRILLAVPWQPRKEIYSILNTDLDQRMNSVVEYWKKKITTVEFDLPKSADRLVNTIRSNLAYILINRDGLGIQPGSRSYERSWMRDGSLTASALLKMGIQNEAREFIEWYAGYQYENGKVPCVVDKRGPDPTPENDSHGQLIFAFLQYYQFTKDKEFLERNFENVRKAVEYMEHLSAQRRTVKYSKSDGIQNACFGLMPKSISHEGYSAKPMHSYWDDFFAMKGYKDAVEIARILEKKKYVKEWSEHRDRFKNDLYNSINKAMQIAKIDYIPGCVELGDFDATSTAIALYPCNELINLPQSETQNTFDRYFEYFEKRRNPDFDWIDYTPYEVRLIGTFIYLGQIERAHALIDFFIDDQRPAAWNHWAEVVRPGYRKPGFIGDMPHTWVSSDFISAARAMFVYEDELGQSLHIGAGLYDDWINNPDGMSVRNLPTYYGLIDYSIRPLENGYTVILGGSIKLPKNGLKISNFKNQLPKMVRVNGQKHTNFTANFIKINAFPADIEIIY